MAIFDGKNYIFEVMRPFLKLVKRDARQIDINQNGTALEFTDFDADVKTIDLAPEIRKFNQWTTQVDVTVPGDINTFYPVVITSEHKWVEKKYTVQRYVHWDGSSTGRLKLEIQAFTDCDCCGWETYWKILEYQRSDRVFISQVVSIAGNIIYDTDRENIIYLRDGVQGSQVEDGGKSALVMWLRGGYRYQFGCDYPIDTVSVYTGLDPIPVSGCTTKEIDGEYSGQVLVDSVFGGDEIVWEGYPKERDKELSNILNVTSSNTGCLNPNPNFYLYAHDYTDRLGLDGSGKNSSQYYKIDKAPVLGRDALFVGAIRTTFIGDNFFRVDGVGKEYKAIVKAYGYSDYEGTKIAFYFGVKCYDRQKLFISYNTIYCEDDGNGSPKFDTLVQDLNPGDTEVVLDGITSIYDGSCSHCRSLAFHPYQEDNGKYCYKDSDGYCHVELGYTRHTFMLSYDEGQITDNGDGTYTITFNKEYNGVPMPSGTRVRSTRYGGTYNYWLSFAQMAMDKKLRYKGSDWRTWNHKDPLDKTIFRNGTYYARLMLLPNYGYKGSDGNWHYNSAEYENLKVWYTNLELQWRNKA